MRQLSVFFGPVCKAGKGKNVSFNTSASGNNLLTSGVILGGTARAGILDGQ
jgi:hypothetical protein